ncbi:hypothetical protein A2434_00080 [Candidatus Woesebacteria bacterium RIFOXYC1_FULL_41_14]|uniref:Uncharacterized protein n=4 Tax=Candidatus Woeseibacteriota TaxID=1752722 RepID=A0A0G0X141_9BACT|nr:MAG: hypothetical protein UU39_C0025G0002 [Candidatus Woesebacteria bacterium GW2011_GWD1_41_12]KKS18774.1 MAG: hypothetical protein UU74_C0001G0006 [Candidatus Woesebacteria bacterium GW2011_GWA1_41_7]OGM80586.1 MAG: hypothetical protein A2393_02900 [Candidatus Woesebacteria bacterium RIFOXYB1_FULL_41_13]OGM84473.1 MAG: hypothetical protein A2434_00080 [Candidatus Woesebacteria bacterium RIFOXYC1_FULL_41_14]OGM88229.1 MAG: hypothetical protein A2594_01400 [Candidatus Woesebacteria bacterium
MDSTTERTGDKARDEQVELRYFEERLAKSPQEVRERYSGILLDEQLRLAKENKGRPVKVPLDVREHFLNMAISGRDVDSVRMSRNMAKYWEAATSKDGRPPIGGAQDD